MKLQHLAVVFCIIIIPISLVLSTYTGNLIKVANTRANYDAVLQNATYDAVRAYQMNTMHNSYASVNKSRERDLLASVNTFYSTLSTGLTLNGYSKAELNTFIPAMLFTLYDGYYVYGPLKNTANVSNGQVSYKTDENSLTDIEYGLKPYTYYSCEYAKGNPTLNVADGAYDITVNYTLDNYITVSGLHNGDYFTASGYYIKATKKTEDTDDYIEFDDDAKKVNIVKKDAYPITIEPERLGEYITFSDEKEVYDVRGTTSTDITTRVIKTKASETPIYYNYINYNEQKYYYEPDSRLWSENTTYNNVPVFYIENNARVYISPNLRDEIQNYIGLGDITNFDNFKDTSAYHYYKDAFEFSRAVYSKLKDININEDVIKTNSYNEEYTVATNDSQTAIENQGNTAHTKAKFEGEAKPFDYLATDNNPEEETSIFNNHRIDVIDCSIESSLVNSIGNFNNYVSSSYSYSMPTLSEEDWYKIATNLTTVAFMEGIPVGNYEFYSNYAIVANTKNKEFVSKESIFVQDTVADGSVFNREISDAEPDSGALYKNYVNKSAPVYHYPGCEEYNTNAADNVIGYRNLDYELQPIENSCVETIEFKDGEIIKYNNKPFDKNNSADTEKLKDTCWENTNPPLEGIWVVRYNDGYATNITKELTQTINYYLQPGTGAYECIIARNEDNISLDDIMKQKKEITLDFENGTSKNITLSDKVVKAFITALAREKNVVYKNHSNLNYHQYGSGAEEVTYQTYEDITKNFR